MAINQEINNSSHRSANYRNSGRHSFQKRITQTLRPRRTRENIGSAQINRDLFRLYLPHKVHRVAQVFFQGAGQAADFVGAPVQPVKGQRQLALGHRGDALHEIVEAFGEDIVAADGTIDRKKLGTIVFADPKNLARLNAITHSRMKGMMREKLVDIEKLGRAIAVLEAALLLEAKWDDLADEIWVTVADPEIAAARVAERSGLAKEQVMERIRSQMPNEDRIKRANIVIDTSGDMASTEKQALDHWKQVSERLASSF